ncbi:tRNA selenocysteine 1-associated protein 1 isoform X2 [Hydra vulgaris]|uniref:tRNA selenocysteine-associated protein 1 n=1 Tax=Hydra vulgaris TaxID=6087 RepID=A0ABM4BDJ9_HYDVU
MATESSWLWMGSISADMDEKFIKEAFANMGFKVLAVKEIFNKTTSERATYCFVDFGDIKTAREVLIKLNGEPIPGIEGKKFKLNRSEYGRGSSHSDGIEYSLFVGDITSDVNDNHLLDFFRIKYPSVRAAKVVIDEKGSHKGYGFVRFFNEEEINRALTEMQGVKGLGQRPIRVNKAVKSKNPINAVASGLMDPNTVFPGWMQMQMNYMQQMYQFMQQCQEYAQQAADRAGLNREASIRSPSVCSSTTIQSNQLLTDHVNQTFNDDEEEEQPEYADPNPHIDIEGMNAEFIDNDNKLFFELEASRWDPEIGLLLALKQTPVWKR